MIVVESIYEEAKRILGACEDSIVFDKITEAVELLANKGTFDPLMGVVDICAQGRCVTLPREIETPLAVNIAGRPTLGRDQLFNFHINGPGDRFTLCDWQWQDGGDSPVYRDLTVPSRLVSFVQRAEDANSELWVYGYDKNGVWIRTKNEDDEWVDGYRVPTLAGYALPDPDSPEFARVTRVKKAVTKGAIRLSSFDNSYSTGTLLGIYQWDETEPLYRRILLSRHCSTNIRMAFRRRTFEIRSLNDLIPLHSKSAVTFMLSALRAYSNDDITLGQAFEATAARFLSEEQDTRTPPVVFPVQVNPRNNLVDQSDYVN